MFFQYISYMSRAPKSLLVLFHHWLWWKRTK